MFQIFLGFQFFQVHAVDSYENVEIQLKVDKCGNEYVYISVIFLFDIKL